MGWERGAKLSICLALVIALFRCSYVESCVEEERLGLLQIKAYLISHSEQGQLITSWSENGHTFNCCAWSMVRCNLLTGRVTELFLASMANYYPSNVGEVNPPWLFNATLFRPFNHLISLDLSNNNINGLVEDHGFKEVSSLKNLELLILDDNNIQIGGLSVASLTSLKKLGLDSCNLDDSNFHFQELAGLRELRVLDLSNNRFHSPIHELLANLAKLEELQILDLGNNNFYGSIQDVCKLKHLQELHLQNNLCNASLPSCFHNLSSLQILDLSSNQFSGNFPDTLTDVTSLHYLDLSYNHIQGKLSLSSFTNHSNLEVLQLSRNKLEIQTEDIEWQPTFQLQVLGLGDCSLNIPNGTVPNFLVHQYHLTKIDLSYNNLVGSFPNWLLNNTKLTTLYLTNNSLTGHLHFPHNANLSLEIFDVSSNNFQEKIPEIFGTVFSNIRYLNMSNNHFQGHIPSSIGHMTELTYLDLSHNNLSGEMPSRLFSHCNGLTVMQLKNNKLEGDIIPRNMNLPKLQWLDLSNNRFGGTINDGLKESSWFLYFLDISNNKVKGQVPKWIGNFTQLLTLSISNNTLQGQIPAEICKLQLSYFDLSLNHFSGHIPSCSNFYTLSHLRLNNNNFTGPIPNALSNSSYLLTLDLRGNQLSGEIPLWINGLSSLRVLLLGRNLLHGEIPHSICQLSKVNILDLSYNRLFGEIPKCFKNMSFGVRVNPMESYHPIMMTSDSLFYEISEEVELLEKNEYFPYVGINLRLMSGLDLSCNNLTGVIPSELGELVQAHSLNLSHNLLFGGIPRSFSNLKQVESLDLSYNDLSGVIPFELVGLNFLEVFNVSYNDFSGKVPETGQFANFDASNYFGNPRLYGIPINKDCCHTENEAFPVKEDEDDGDTRVDFLWSFGTSCIVMFLATILILCINSQWRRAWFDFVDWHVFRWLPMQ